MEPRSRGSTCSWKISNSSNLWGPQAKPVHTAPHQHDADPDLRSALGKTDPDPALGERFLQVLFPLLIFPSLYFSFFNELNYCML